MKRNVNGRLAAALVLLCCLGLAGVGFTSVGGSITARPDAAAQKGAVVVRGVQAMNALGFVAALNALHEHEVAAAGASGAPQVIPVKHAVFLEDYFDGARGAVVVEGELQAPDRATGRFSSLTYQARCLSRVEIRDADSEFVFTLEHGEVFPLTASGAYGLRADRTRQAAMHVGCRLDGLRGQVCVAEELWSGLMPTTAAVSAFLDSLMIYEEPPGGAEPRFAHAMQGRFELDLWHGLDNARAAIDIQPGPGGKRVELTLNGKREGAYTMGEFSEEFGAGLSGEPKTVQKIEPRLPKLDTPEAPQLRNPQRSAGYTLCSLMA
jgi:hypothetical protein